VLCMVKLRMGLEVRDQDRYGNESHSHPLRRQSTPGLPRGQAWSRGADDRRALTAAPWPPGTVPGPVPEPRMGGMPQGLTYLAFVMAESSKDRRTPWPITPDVREIVGHGWGPGFRFSREAVERLRHHGFRALRMEDGVVEWADPGSPVAAGPRADR
jgi:hypothetical protein